MQIKTSYETQVSINPALKDVIEKIKLKNNKKRPGSTQFNPISP
jgi:hypothetical protein